MNHIFSQKIKSIGNRGHPDHNPTNPGGQVVWFSCRKPAPSRRGTYFLHCPCQVVVVFHFCRLSGIV